MKFKLWLEAQEDWKSLVRGRQKEFPFQYEPGVQRKASGFADPDMYDPEMEDKPLEHQNMYHVTTALDAVKKSGQLKSRAELGGANIGLGGGPAGESPWAVSVTYDEYRARDIYDEIKSVSALANGQVPASTVFNSMLGRIDAHNEELEGKIYDSLTDYGIPKKELEKIKFGDTSIIDKYIKTPKDIYEFYQSLENIIIGYETEADADFLGGYEMGVIGFTAPFEQMKKIKPDQVAIIQVAARKGADPEQVPYEKELRFWPEDLWIVRYYQP